MTNAAHAFEYSTIRAGRVSVARKWSARTLDPGDRARRPPARMGAPIVRDGAGRRIAADADGSLLPRPIPQHSPQHKPQRWAPYRPEGRTERRSEGSAIRPPCPHGIAERRIRGPTLGERKFAARKRTGRGHRHRPERAAQETPSRGN